MKRLAKKALACSRPDVLSLSLSPLCLALLNTQSASSLSWVSRCREKDGRLLGSMQQMGLGRIRMLVTSAPQEPGPKLCEKALCFSFIYLEKTLFLRLCSVETLWWFAQSPCMIAGTQSQAMLELGCASP